MLYSITQDETCLRKPFANDGYRIHQLVQNCPPLDLNSVYGYHLIARHHAHTCIVAEHRGELVGFISAYVLPERPNALFIWQVAVDDRMRGKGIAKMMLNGLIARPELRPITQLETTVNPSNRASRGLFEKFCQQHGHALNEERFLEESDFGPGDHEAEIMLRINLCAAQEENRYANY